MSFLYIISKANMVSNKIFNFKFYFYLNPFIYLFFNNISILNYCFKYN